MTGQTDTIDQTQSWRKPILAFKASAITLRDDIGVLLLEVLIQEAAMHKTKVSVDRKRRILFEQSGTAETERPELGQAD